MHDFQEIFPGDCFSQLGFDLKLGVSHYQQRNQPLAGQALYVVVSRILKSINPQDGDYFSHYVNEGARALRSYITGPSPP